MTPGAIPLGNPGPMIMVFQPPPGSTAYLPPCGFAIDGRPEAARQYPAGRELATEANASLATEASRLLPQ